MENNEQEWVDEINSGINDHIQSIIQQEVDKIMIDPSKIADNIVSSNFIHPQILNVIHRFTENEISNRLRCGIHDAFLMDKIFDSLWTQEFEKAIESRIRQKAEKIAEEIVRDKIKNLIK